MANEVSIGKRLKISKAQQNMLAAVLGASMVLGISAVLAIYFVKVIRFNSTVITEKEAAVQSYSSAIEEIGVCTKPRGKVYSTAELESCSPNEVEVEDVQGSLRYKVLVEMAQNKSLESVARESLPDCYNSVGEKYSHEYWNDKYQNAVSDESREYYIQVLGMCSALRVIPDALPASRNELALMASLDKIFEISNWTPESLSPGGVVETEIEGLGAIELNLSVQADGERTLNVLNNIEKSIREFGINTATIEWNGGQLTLDAKATAYFTEEKGLVEATKTVTGDGNVVDSATAGEEL